MASEMDVIRKLDKIRRLHIADLFHDTGPISDDIPSLCTDINTVVTAFIEKPECVDLSQDICVNFLINTLPALVEVFLRKNSRWLNYYVLIFCVSFVGFFISPCSSFCLQ